MREDIRRVVPAVYDVRLLRWSLAEKKASIEVLNRSHYINHQGNPDDYRSTIRRFVNQKWVPYSQRYLFNLSLTLTITLTLLTLILDIGLSNPRIINTLPSRLTISIHVRRSAKTNARLQSFRSQTVQVLATSVRIVTVQDRRQSPPRHTVSKVNGTAHTLMSIFTTASRCLSRDTRATWRHSHVIQTSARKFRCERLMLRVGWRPGPVPCDCTKHVIRALCLPTVKREKSSMLRRPCRPGCPITKTTTPWVISRRTRTLS